MIIDFNGMQEMTMPCMNDGTGMMTVKMYNDENYRIIPTKIHRGGSIVNTNMVYKLYKDIVYTFPKSKLSIVVIEVHCAQLATD